jgi:hypothetical protein
MPSWFRGMSPTPTSSTGSNGGSSEGSTGEASSDTNSYQLNATADKVNRLLMAHSIDESVRESIVGTILLKNSMSHNNWLSLLTYLKGDSKDQLALSMNTELLENLGIILNISKEFTKHLTDELNKGALLTRNDHRS